jgi:hypothetical protein
METNNNAQGKGAFSQLNKNKMQHNDPNNPYAGSIAPPPVETNQQEQTHGQAHQQPQVQEQVLFNRRMPHIFLLVMSKMGLLSLTLCHKDIKVKKVGIFPFF